MREGWSLPPLPHIRIHNTAASYRDGVKLGRWGTETHHAVHVLDCPLLVSDKIIRNDLDERKAVLTRD